MPTKRVSEEESNQQGHEKVVTPTSGTEQRQKEIHDQIAMGVKELIAVGYKKKQKENKMEEIKAMLK